MPDLDLERQFQGEGYPVIAGIDEAGRGPLAGPVVAAAVILPADFSHPTLNDSKQLTAPRREALYGEITSHAGITWASAAVEPEEIDRINILQATYLAMRTAVIALSRMPDAVLIDGKPVPRFPLPHRGVVKGDSLSLSIAAASIIAKVERDRIMCDFAETYPAYGFEKHKGYGTRKHLESLKIHGPCPIHRRSFAPVAQMTLDFG